MGLAKRNTAGKRCACQGPKANSSAHRLEEQEALVWLSLREGGEGVQDKAGELRRYQITPPHSGTFPSMLSPIQSPKYLPVGSHTPLSGPGLQVRGEQEL